jgi:hypothetical protein
MRNLLIFFILAFLYNFQTAFASTKDSSKSNLYVYVNSGVFCSSNPSIRENFKPNIFFSPVIGVSFNDEFSPFAEYAYVKGEIDTFKDEKKNIRFTQNFISVGLMNKVNISSKLIFNVKYGLSTLIMKNENLALPTSRIGFIGGAGFESYVTNNFSINIGASYIYQTNNSGGFRFEPGLQFKF